ncbi:GNAT family N-acetyltransferase [Vibrio sp.]|uniref:GNAT family N-acetyltransferase n=1 Tax=Vibrio viridaestus TaxID=2487322 RepID=A0A3N9U2C0_9VIBR|nr:GNAT family N-acetyltransferase [Vibrio viridaestus]MDC0610719.1 GNAT family N-acetyltransferase [Vibrio sp.]RQW63652.1 GNAT family N-acetyltransferase [Vibrio viridaestus]
MEALILTLATARDVKALKRLMYQLHDEHHQAEPDFFKTADEICSEKDIKQYIEQPDGLVYCAIIDGEIVGFVTAHFSEWSSTVSKPIFMGSIDELYVLPKYRSQGIGKKLLTRIEKELKDYGVKQIFVEVWAFNKTAVEVYESIGFSHHIHWLRKSL